MAEYKINMTPDLVPPMLAISQNDVGRTITIKLIDYDRAPYVIPSGAQLTLVGTKPSGLGFTVIGTYSGSIASFVTTAEMSDEAGRIPCEVRITNGSTVIGSCNADLYVEANPHPSDVTDGTAEHVIDTITALVNQAVQATENAAQSALRAEDAAQRAEEATAKITEVVAVAETLPEGSQATANYDEGILTLGIPRGNTGATGAQGERGLQGVGISNVVLNSDYTLTINLTDGTSYTTSSIRGAQGERGVQGERGLQGEQGERGERGLQGERGVQGETGATGVGISNVTLNADYTLTITLSDGTSYTTGSIRGAQGERGLQGEQGVQGERGETGTAATIAVGTVASGTTASVTNSGTSSAAVFDFVLPKGEAGKDAELTILKYGISTWQDFITAYATNTVIYCRASSNSNPATGSQTRLAFMAYVNNETNPTEVEFQYYRSVNTHTDSQQGDQVFVYKLTSAGAWTVTTRNAFTKIDVGSGLSKTYSNGTLTVNLDLQTWTGGSY